MRREVLLLRTDPPSGFVNAAVFLDAQKGVEFKNFMRAFDSWIAGQNNKRRHHGFDKSEYGGRYTHCYVFKDSAEGGRLYGLLKNPKPDDRRFQACVVVHHTHKKEWRTDEAVLKGVSDWNDKEEVIKAIEEYYTNQ